MKKGHALREAVHNATLDIVEVALIQCGGDAEFAAAELGIHTRSLYRYLREIKKRGTEMGKRVTSQSGRSQLRPVGDQSQVRYESADRRLESPICQSCLDGFHAKCPNENCPCVCNDSDFKFVRTSLKKSPECMAAETIAAILQGKGDNS